ncbi:MAG: hypothetical protein AAGF71_05750 [Pseudomonadota bacterium]
MKYRGLVGIVSLVGLVAGCSTVKGPSSQGVTAEFASPEASAFVAGFQPSKINVTKDGVTIPASCSIASEKFSVAFQAPNTVNLPAYSQGSVPVTLTCTYGEASQSMGVAPINLSKRARTNSAVGVALLCPICGIGVAAANAGSNKTNDIFGFADMDMEFPAES